MSVGMSSLELATSAGACVGAGGRCDGGPRRLGVVVVVVVAVIVVPAVGKGVGFTVTVAVTVAVGVGGSVLMRPESSTAGIPVAGSSMTESTEPNRSGLATSSLPEVPCGSSSAESAWDQGTGPPARYCPLVNRDPIGTVNILPTAMVPDDVGPGVSATAIGWPMLLWTPRSSSTTQVKSSFRRPAIPI